MGRGAIALIAICAVISVVVAADYWMNSGKVYGGIEAGGVSLGGMTRAEAEDALADRATGPQGAIELSGAETLSLTPEEVGADYDVAATAGEAYGVGREGSIPERLSERMRAAFGTVEIPLSVDYRTEEVRERVAEIAARLDAEPRDASVAIEGPNVLVTDSAEGYELDVAATLSGVEAAIRSIGGEAELAGEVLTPEVTTAEAEQAASRARAAMSGPLTLASGEQEWTISPAEVGTALEVTQEDGAIQVGLRKGGLGEYMGDMYEELNAEPKEAGFVMEGEEFSVTPSEIGRRIEDQKFFDDLESGVFEGESAYEIPVAETKPELTTAEAREQKPTTMLGSYETNYLTYDDSPGRVDNLEISSNAVDGTTLVPGEVFSFNELAEPLDYADTKVIVDGRTDTAEGGGLCQVSSTLYMAANLAGMETVERQPHYAELPYIRPGFDATVWFGAIDYKFENTNDSPVYIREWVDQSTGTVHSEIWGRPDNVDVQMNSEQVAEYEDDEGNPVTEWVTYKTVTENGEVTFDGVVNNDTYKYLKPAEEDAPSVGRPPN